MAKSRWTLSYKEIYNHYNYDSLNYIIDIIHGLYSNYRDKESKILSTLIRYDVSQIEEKYKSLTKGQIHRLWKNQEQALKNIFGYYKITKSNNVHKSLLNIKKFLREIYDCYLFCKESYNSYKHGYRLWFGRDQNQIDVAIYVLRRGKRKRRKYVPSDDGSLLVVLKCSRYCRQLFDILIENQRQIAIIGKKKASNKIDILFLKKKNNDFIVQKQSC
jgi:hypothetical protein